MNQKYLQGFSLAEVLVAIVIIAILTIGSLAVYTAQIQKGRDTERRNDTVRIKALLDTVIAEYGAPPGEDSNSRKLKKRGEACKSREDLLDCFKLLQLSTEDDLNEMFADPSQGILNDRTDDKRYGYLYGANENSFKICTMLEDQGSSDLNSKYSGEKSINEGAYDNLYCINNTAMGAEEVDEVIKLSHPYDEN